jgi:ribosomal protein L37AE/L43A
MPNGKPEQHHQENRCPECQSTNLIPPSAGFCLYTCRSCGKVATTADVTGHEPTATPGDVLQEIDHADW